MAAGTGSGSSTGFTLDMVKQERVYSERICVKVVKPDMSCYKAERSVTKVCFADTTTWLRGKVMSKHEGMFKDGRSLALRGANFQGGFLVVKDSSTVYRTAPVEVPEGIVLAAEAEFLKPINKFIKIAGVLESTEYRKVSTKGVVVTNQQEQQITTRHGEQIVKKEVELKDETGTVLCTLWRSCCQVPLEVGDLVVLKDVNATFSTYHKKVTLSVNNVENIEVNNIDELQSCCLVGVQNEEVENRMNILIVLEDVERDVVVDWKRLAVFLGISEETNLEDLLQLFPINCKCRTKNNEILELQ